MAALSCLQVALIFTACFAPGLASRHQVQLGMIKEAPSPPAAAPAGAPMGSPGPAPGPAGPCECRFEDYCTCGGALAYLDCITRTCAMEECNCVNNTVQFSKSCGQMASECKSDLDITCSSSQATCEGKYNQAADGIIGLNMAFDKITSDAYCGPTGRCAGTVQAAVTVHKPAKGVRLSCALEPRQGKSLVLQQSHSLRKPEEAKAEKTETQKDEKETKKVTKQHKTEKKVEEKESKEDKDKDSKEEKEDDEKTEVGNQEHFGITGLAAHEKGLLTCNAKVEGDEATCTMDMPLRLKPEGDIEGLCRLVNEATDEVITKDAWFVIRNPYDKPKTKAEPKKMEAPARSGSVLTSSAVALAITVFAAAMML